MIERIGSCLSAPEEGQVTDAQVVERKLAVILAADVAEYSRLMGADEVRTLRTLQAYRAILDRLIAAHRSVEPGHAIVLDRLGLVPILQLDLRLGEGSGAALAMGLLDGAARHLAEMATFGEAGVSGAEGGGQ